MLADSREQHHGTAVRVGQLSEDVLIGDHKERLILAPDDHRYYRRRTGPSRWLLDRYGRLTITIPETVEAGAGELAPALAAA